MGVWLSRVALVLVAISAPWAPRSAYAHDLGTRFGFSTAAQLREALRDLDTLPSEEQREAAKSLLAMSKRWQRGSVLRVCMHHQDQRLRRVIASVASEWLESGASLRFDFGNPDDPRRCADRDPAEIRVGDDPGSRNGRYWSAIGTDAGAYRPGLSMNLAFTADLSGPAVEAFERGDRGYRSYFHFLVLHEFGHAIGALHEQQWGECVDHLDMDAYIRRVWNVDPASLSASQREWYAQQVKRLTADEARQYGAWRVSDREDPRSIMRYDASSGFYTAGAPAFCSWRNAERLSGQDLRGIGVAYPRPGDPPPTGTSYLAVRALAESLATSPELSLAARETVGALARELEPVAAPSPASRALLPAGAPPPPASTALELPLPRSFYGLLNATAGGSSR
jgi:hypothetical protein